MDINQYNTTVRSDKIDSGLRAYMLSIYNFMTGGLALTGAVAFFVASSPALLSLIFGNQIIALIAMFSPFIFILVLNFGINKLSLGTARLLFWIFAAVMGLSLSSIFMVYTGASIARVFFITATVFGIMSIYGYTTKKDLTAIGSFLIMAVLGLFIAMIVNIFLKSTMLELAVSVIGVIVFTLLVAFDTQRLKSLYYQVAHDGTAAGKVAIMGALSLYLDFLNIFLFLLRLMGQKK